MGKRNKSPKYKNKYKVKLIIHEEREVLASSEEEAMAYITDGVWKKTYYTPRGRERLQRIAEYTDHKKVLKKTEANELKNLCISLNKKNYKKKIKKPKKSKHKLNSHEQDDIIYNLQNKSYKFIKIASNKKILKIATDYLNYGSYKKEHIILHQLTGRSPISNAGDQTLHLDSRIPGLKFPIKVVATVMLEDFNYSNGATRLFPSSHLLKRFPKKKG